MPTIHPAGFEEIEHTADWSLRIWAPDMAGLLKQAAKGMHQLSGISLAPGERVTRRITVEAVDAEGLLVNFLGELLHILDQEGLAFDQYELSVAENVVIANLEGTKVAARKKEIKAVTYHNLKVKTNATRLEAELVFDV
ncbi:MAG: archease [Anaerolineales bacterium]